MVEKRNKVKTMNKNAKAGALPWVLGFFGIAIVAIFLMVLGVIPGFGNVLQDKTGDGTQTFTCPDTKSTTLSYEIRDTEASSFSILFPLDMKFVGNTQTVADTSDAGSTSATFNSSVSLNCGETYTPYVLPSATSNGVKGGSFTTKSATDQASIEGSSSSGLQAQIWDVTSRVFLETGQSSAYTAISATWNETTSVAYINISPVADLDVEISYKTVTADTTYKGGKGECIWAIDADVAEFDKPDVEGETVKELAGAGLSAKTVTALSGYEYIVKGSPATDTSKKVRVTFSALSGVDPTSDVKMKLICADYFVSNTDASKVLYDYFTDAPSPAQVHNAGTAEEITFDNI